MKLALTVFLAPLITLAAVGFLLSLFVHLSLLTGLYQPPFELWLAPYCTAPVVFISAFPLRFWLRRELKADDNPKDSFHGCPPWLRRFNKVIWVYGLANFFVLIAGLLLGGASVDLGPAARIVSAGWPGFLMAWHSCLGSLMYSALIVIRQGATPR